MQNRFGWIHIAIKILMREILADSKQIFFLTVIYAVFNGALSFINWVLVAAQTILCLSGSDSVKSFLHFTLDRHECFHHDGNYVFEVILCKQSIHFLSALINRHEIGKCFMMHVITHFWQVNL